MSAQDKKTDLIQLPPESEPFHLSISQKAAEILGSYVDGNGMKADQIRLNRDETHIHRIPGSITVKLTTEKFKSTVKGKAARGSWSARR